MDNSLPKLGGNFIAVAILIRAIAELKTALKRAGSSCLAEDIVGTRRLELPTSTVSKSKFLSVLVAIVPLCNPSEMNDILATPEFNVVPNASRKPSVFSVRQTKLISAAKGAVPRSEQIKRKREAFASVADTRAFGLFCVRPRQKNRHGDKICATSSVPKKDQDARRGYDHAFIARVPYRHPFCFRLLDPIFSANCSA